MLLVLIVQKPKPIVDTQGIDAAIIPPSGEEKKAFAFGDAVMRVECDSTYNPYPRCDCFYFEFHIHVYGSILIVRKIFFAVACLLFTILVSVALFVSLRSGNTEPVVNLETHKTLPASADSDGDGVPNWLEEIHGSDSLNTSSFPYNRDVVQAKKNVENDLLYDGPGDFTEEIVQRFLFDLEGSASVDEEERGRFAAESADYFLKNVEERDLPDIALVVDNTVSTTEKS